jgi:hypothetical protein
LDLCAQLRLTPELEAKTFSICCRSSTRRPRPPRGTLDARNTRPAGDHRPRVAPPWSALAEVAYIDGIYLKQLK